ncbi:MAG: hypothetical protein R3F62_01460 [Planctomycetota bacterium]
MPTARLTREEIEGPLRASEVKEAYLNAALDDDNSPASDPPGSWAGPPRKSPRKRVTRRSEPRPPTRAFKIGELVVEVDGPATPESVRVIVGYRQDGAAVTSFVKPAPWVERQARFFEVEVSQLREAPSDIVQTLRSYGNPQD